MMKKIRHINHKWSNILSKTPALALVLILTMVSSCKKDYLEVNPQGEINAGNFFETEDHAIWATNATYSILREWDLASFPLLALTDMVSDDALKGSFPADGQRLEAFQDFSYGPSFPDDIRLAWKGQYQGIFRANMAIANIPDIDMDETLRARLVAENKFLRAFFYFNLVRWFGDIPLITKPLEADEFYTRERNTVSEVYALIIADLEDGIQNLPKKSQYPPADLGRVTSGAAAGLLAKVYLTMEDFPNAEKYALEVINSGEYSLYPEYAKIFRREGENSSESLFEVQSTALETSWDAASPYNMVQGVRGTPNLGWGFNQPTDDLIAEFEPGDPRREATVLGVGEQLPDGSGFVQDNPDMFNEKYNEKAWVEDHPGLQDNGPGNIRKLRYADVLLVAAEALNENGKNSESLMYLNMVRDRARGNRPASILPKVTLTDKDALRKKIWKERRVELAMEQHRWFDLIRTGQAFDKLGDKGFVQGKHELFPIPQTEIDLAGGVWQQNPNY